MGESDSTFSKRLAAILQKRQMVIPQIVELRSAIPDYFVIANETLNNTQQLTQLLKGHEDELLQEILNAAEQAQQDPAHMTPAAVLRMYPLMKNNECPQGSSPIENEEDCNNIRRVILKNTPGLVERGLGASFPSGCFQFGEIFFFNQNGVQRMAGYARYCKTDKNTQSQQAQYYLQDQGNRKQALNAISWSVDTIWSIKRLGWPEMAAISRKNEFWRRQLFVNLLISISNAESEDHETALKEMKALAKYHAPAVEWLELNGNRDN